MLHHLKRLGISTVPGFFFCVSNSQKIPQYTSISLYEWENKWEYKCTKKEGRMTAPNGKERVKMKKVQSSAKVETLLVH